MDQDPNNGDVETDDVEEEEEEVEDSDEIEMNNEDFFENDGFLPYLQGLLGRSRRDDESESSGDESTGSETGVTFDRTLPSQHSYLGTGTEISGRTILEENEIQNIRILQVPGQELNDI